MSTQTTTKPDIDKLLSNVKNGYLPINVIYGVDQEKATVTHHPDLYQPKTDLRRDVIESVKLAKTPDQVPPIEIMLMEDGEIGVVDGYHRITAFLEYNNENPKDDKFRRIRVTRNFGNLEDAEFAAVRENLDSGRSNLTAAEELTAFERFLAKGYTPDEINDKLGGGHKRYVKQLEEIVGANPAIAKAVKQGRVSIETATKVVRKTGVADQPAAIERAAQVEQAKGGVKARQELGLRAAKPQVMKIGEIYNWVATWYPMYREQVEADPTGQEVDDNLDGKFEAVVHILKLDTKTKKQQLTHFDGIVKEIEERLAKKNAPKPIKEKAPKAPKPKAAAKPKAPADKKPKPVAAGPKTPKPSEIIVVGEKGGAKPKPVPVRPKVPTAS